MGGCKKLSVFQCERDSFRKAKPAVGQDGGPRGGEGNERGGQRAKAKVEAINDSGLGWGIRTRLRAPVLLFTLGGTERDLPDVQALRPGMPVGG